MEEASRHLICGSICRHVAVLAQRRRVVVPGYELRWRVEYDSQLLQQASVLSST
jgi:hypothetical protein